MLTKIQSFCTLRTPFDKLLTLFLTMGLTQFNLSKNISFYNYAHNSGARGSPDMILSAFDVKFNEKKDEIPPRACRPFQPFCPFRPFRLSKTQKSSKVNKFAKHVHPPELVYPSLDFSLLIQL